jgi:uncharacterized DUF497 family protein
MPEEFEWDQEKNRTNLAKHGVSFEEVRAIFDGPVFTAPDDRRDYGEERFISYGQLGTLVVAVVVHTSRGGPIRLISARKASRKERQAYYEHFKETAQGN